MQKLTAAGQNMVNDMSSRYWLSVDAVVHMLGAVNNGAGSMAQFNCPELGGSGQWMRGGMTMTSDMFNHSLNATVDNLCNDLANALSSTQVFPVIPAGTPGSLQWWPQELGSPSSSGAQNNIRYAIFLHRLAVELNGQVTVYDTLDHNIGGVSQQQGGDTSLTFSSQYGNLAVSSLPVISGPGLEKAPQTNFATPAEIAPEPYESTPVSAGAFQTPTEPEQAIKIDNINSIEALELIEKMSALHDAGILSNDEFTSKKAELLARI